MPLFTWRSAMPASAADVFAWHARAGALERLMPPWQRYRLVERTGTGIQDGARLVFEIGMGPLWLRWVALHSGYQAGRQFRDEQIQGPFDSWQHTHRFVPEGEDTSWLEDEVDYAAPFSPLGDVLGSGYLRGRLERLFRFAPNCASGGPVPVAKSWLESPACPPTVPLRRPEGSA